VLESHKAKKVVAIAAVANSKVVVVRDFCVVVSLMKVLLGF
jgi:hypothetical protein